VDLHSDPGFVYLTSAEAEDELRDLGVGEAGDRDQILGNVKLRYVAMLQAGKVRNGRALALTMVRNGARSLNRSKAARWREHWRAVGKASGKDLREIKEMLKGHRPHPPEAITAIDPESGEERDRNEPELRSESAERAWEQGLEVQELDALDERLTMALQQLFELLSVLRQAGVKCPLHPGGCPVAPRVTAIAQQIVTWLLNLTLGKDTLTTNGAPVSAQAGSLSDLFALAAGLQFDNSPAGRQRRARIRPCVLYLLWEKARETENSRLIGVFARELRHRYERVIAGADHRRAEERLRRWLDENPPEQPQ
jgi:hypothetical protein